LPPDKHHSLDIVYRRREELCLAHNAKVKTDMPEKNEKTAGVRGVSPVGGKVEELWRKYSLRE